MEGLTGAPVYAGGGTIDTNGQNITVNQPLVAPTGQGVSGATIDTAGFGYRVAPIVVVTRGAGDTTGTGATAVAQINSAGAVTGITITNPGTDYTQPPVFQLLANAATSYANMQVPFGTASTVVTAQTAVVTATINPNIGGGITKVGAGTLSFTGSNTYSGATTIEAGTLRLGVDAQSPVATGAGADIKSGSLAMVYSGTSNIQTVRGLLASGKIHSSTATAQVGLGYSDDGAAAVTVTRAVFGDANLDGVVNSSDFGALATAFNNSSGTWVTGDFNYDGTVNALDFNTLATNYGATLPAPALGSLVPEPMSMGLIGIGAIGLMRRRRQTV
jgi:autotransporter-associated beta strand protein